MARVSRCGATLALSDYAIQFVSDVVGVLIGAWLGYLFGLRQQRQIDAENERRRRAELREALKDELAYVSKEVRTRSDSISGRVVELDFSTVYIDLPTYTSIINSGQLLLLDSELIRSLRELNTQVHAHNTAQTVFVGVSESMSPAAFAAHAEECRKVLADPKLETSDRLAGLLKVIVSKREIIAQEAEATIKELSTAASSQQ